MPESRESRWVRFKFNIFPAYRGTGARVTYVASDFREIRIELPLSWRSRNVVGTIFGGSMYAAVDPMLMIMLMKNLGRDYVVWDKAATIRFRRPGRTTLHATFLISQEEIDAIRAAAADGQPLDRFYNVDLVDAEGTVHASVEKVIYVRKTAGTAAQ